MDLQEILVAAVAIPFGLTLVVLLAAAWWTGNSARRERYLSGIGAWSLAAAYLTCHLGVHGKPAGQLLEAWEWLLLLMPLAALFGWGDTVLAWPYRRRLAAALPLAAFAGLLVVPSFQEPHWPWRAAVAGTVLTLIVALTYAAGRVSALTLLSSWVVIGACGLPILIASANAKFGFFSTSISAAAGAAILVRLVASKQAAAFRVDGFCIPIAMIFGTLYFSGYFNDYGDVPLSAFVLLMVSPLAVLFGVPVSRHRPNSWAAVAAGLVPVICMCAVAVFLAWPALTAESAY